ncbi:BQ2448_734 [Microbotryum intermedium]|uniref:BQ2448_734 protein n=1 Tax=Microbotryum intermedium TaxID=269621 RepID=A0A238F9C2_9BASI|nr:BQ2448_734 [Microbotryum intermedium]
MSSMPPKLDLSGIRNKVVRGQLLAKQKRDKAQAKLKRRIARKEAENRGEEVEKGWTHTIENTREWLGESDEFADARTRPAPVKVDDATGDVTVDLGTLATLFPASTAPPLVDGQPVPKEPKMLITTSPGKPPAPLTRDFLADLQALMGGKSRADIVPRKSPKFELGRVARWARKRGYGAIAVVGEDHAKPTTLTLSLLPHGPTAHFRLSLASLLSHLFLPPSAADLLARQGYQGRQVVLAQNSRDFVFIRRYRYMFALKGERLGSKKKVGLERQQPEDKEEDDTIKTRFQEIGPRMTIKMRWIRRAALGETGDERDERERNEKAAGVDEDEGTFGEVEQGEDPDLGEVGGSGRRNKGKGRAGDDDEDEKDDGEQEAEAARAIGLGEGEDAGTLSIDPETGAARSEAKDVDMTEGEASPPTTTDEPRKKKRPRTTPRKRSKPFHPLLRPRANSASPPPGELAEPEAIPLPPKNGKKKDASNASVLSSVGKTWHAGRGEGGVREAKKRQEWEWEAKMQVSRRKFFL